MATMRQKEVEGDTSKSGSFHNLFEYHALKTYITNSDEQWVRRMDCGKIDGDIEVYDKDVCVSRVHLALVYCSLSSSSP